jgi:hypothetical protein
MGFAKRFIHYAMLSVSSVHYSVLVNTDKVGVIQPRRELRQGDPLFHTFFILIAKGLSTLISKAVTRGDIHGVQICRGAPMMSHILFVDNCFLFCMANLSEINQLMEYSECMKQRSIKKLIWPSQRCLCYPRYYGERYREDVKLILVRG